MTTDFFPTLDDLLGARQQRFFGAGYKNTDLQVRDVRMNRTAKTLEARLDIELNGHWSAHHGQQRLYHLSNIEALVVAGQCAQALLYWLDGLAREDVDNLWLRGLSIVNTRPVEAITNIAVEVRCRAFEHSAIGTEAWRHATLDILLGGRSLIIKDYKACYRLPRQHVQEATA